MNLSVSLIDKNLARQVSEETNPSRVDVTDTPLLDSSKSSKTANKNKYNTRAVQKNSSDSCKL